MTAIRFMPRPRKGRFYERSVEVNGLVYVLMVATMVMTTLAQWGPIIYDRVYSLAVPPKTEEQLRMEFWMEVCPEGWICTEEYVMDKEGNRGYYNGTIVLAPAREHA